VLADAPHHSPDVLLLATGNEVTLCIAAYEQLKAEGIHARVISTPSWELLESQNQEYRDSVLPPEITARVAVEAASCSAFRQAINEGKGRLSTLS
jgi:transketolase